MTFNDIGGITELTFETSDQRGAGTDSNIYVVLHGLKGDTREFRMQNFEDENGHSNIFERGDINKFKLRYDQSIGMLYAITVRSDGRFAGSDWRLSSIEFKQNENNIELNNGLIAINEWIDAETRTFELPIPEVSLVNQEKPQDKGEERLVFGEAKSFEKQGSEIFIFSSFKNSYKPVMVMADLKSDQDEVTGLRLLPMAQENGNKRDNFNQKILENVSQLSEILVKKKMNNEIDVTSFEWPIVFRADNEIETYKSMWLRDGDILNLKIGEAPLSIFVGHELKFLMALIVDN